MDKPVNDQNSDARKFWENLYKTAAPFIDRHTIPIFRNKNGELDHHGTGILVKSEKHYFLVSAAHVLEINLSKEIVLAVNSTTGLPLNKIAKFTPHIEELKDRDNDKIDIAVVRFFESELLDQLKESKTFLPIESIIENHNDNEGSPNYIVFGYPDFGIEFNQKKSNIEIESEIMVMPTKISPFKKFENYACNPEDHIFVEYFKHMTTSNGRRSLNHIKPHGISGCGLWYINSEKLRTEKKIRYALVGVIIECRLENHRVLIATKTKHVLNLIKAHIKMDN